MQKFIKTASVLHESRSQRYIAAEYTKIEKFGVAVGVLRYSLSRVQPLRPRMSKLTFSTHFTVHKYQLLQKKNGRFYSLIHFHCISASENDHETIFLLAKALHSVETSETTEFPVSI